MKRRAFLQSVLAGTAALTLPKSVRTATRTTELGDVEERQYDFELLREPRGVDCMGFQLEVPGGGRAVATIRIPEGSYVQLVSLMAHVRDGPGVLIYQPRSFAMPVHSSNFLDDPLPMESPAFHHKLPLVLELEATTPDAADLVLALFFRAVPTDCGRIPTLEEIS